MLSLLISQFCRRCQGRFIRFPVAQSYAAVGPMRISIILPALPGIEAVRYAGHSHWQNIRHTKEAKDSERQKMINSVVRRIRNAVREGGNTNPALNSQLARVLEEGKSKAVPGTTMQETLKKLEKSKDIKGSVVYIEGKGLTNCLLIVEVFTDRPKWMRQAVQHILKKYGGSIGDSGSSRSFFEFKGVVYVSCTNEKITSKDDALEIAIEVGAEEVTDGLSDDGTPTYLFICEPTELHAVKKSLNEIGVETNAARLEFLPHTFTLIDSEVVNIASNMLNDIEQLDEVVRVYDNIQCTSES